MIRYGLQLVRRHEVEVCHRTDLWLRYYPQVPALSAPPVFIALSVYISNSYQPSYPQSAFNVNNVDARDVLPRGIVTWQSPFEDIYVGWLYWRSRPVAANGAVSKTKVACIALVPWAVVGLCSDQQVYPNTQTKHH